MRCASVSVGIVDYEAAYYRSSSMRLEHAADDADAFHRYATTAWDADADHHKRLVDRQATAPALSGAFAELSSEGAFDLLLVYMSGHGEIGADGNGWFCLSDAKPGDRSLDGAMLAAMLEKVESDRVVLLLDCCHAEAVAAGMAFFARLDGTTARLFVASARSDQRAWEDSSLRRSIFSDAVIRALSTDSTVADANGRVDVEAALLPWLRKQVPLASAALKNGEDQVPVSGGISTSAVLLPLVTSSSLGRELTIAQTVRRRLRRLAAVLFLGAVASLLLADAMAYHLAVSGSGQIVVRPGLAWTYQLMPFHIGPVVDTGLTLADVDPNRGEFVAALSSGSLAGIASHLDASRLRPWFLDIRDGLRRDSRATFAALATGEATAVDPSDASPPTDAAGFLAARGQPIEAVATAMYPLDADLQLPCSQPAARNIDVSLLSPSAEAFASDLAWYAATAPVDLGARLERVMLIVRLAAYRSGFQKDADAVDEGFKAFARALSTLTQSSADPARLRSAAETELPAMARGWCQAHARYALAALSAPDPRREQEDGFVRDLGNALEDEIGTSWTPRQRYAYLSLRELGERGLLTDSGMQPAARAVEEKLGDLSADTAAPAFIKAVAPATRLPSTLVSVLVGALRTSDEERDFARLSAFATLAANSKYLGEPLRDEVVSWANANFASMRTMSDVHRGLGYLAPYGVMNAPNLALLQQQLTAMSRFPARATSYRGETVINAGGDDALIALGRAAQVVKLPDDVLRRIANAVMGRPLLQGRDAVVRGLATQWYGNLDAGDATEAIVSRLAAARDDSDWRALEVEVAAALLADQAVVARSKTVGELLDAWARSVEPEQRTAIARVIARTPRGPGVSGVAPELLPRR